MTAKDPLSVSGGHFKPELGDNVTDKGSTSMETSDVRGVADPFRIGSVTKTMIGTVVLQLVQEGKLSLDAPLAKWFPEFPNAGAITVDDLLRMRSGIWDSWTGAALAAYYDDPLHPPGVDAMIARSAAEGARFTAP